MTWGYVLTQLPACAPCWTRRQSGIKGRAAAAATKSLQWCPTLCDPIDGSPPDSPVPGILQASKNTGVGCHFLLQGMKVKVKSLSRVRFLATPWIAAHQAPPSMGFSRQECWSGEPSPSPRERHHPAKSGQADLCQTSPISPPSLYLPYLLHTHSRTHACSLTRSLNKLPGNKALKAGKAVLMM